MPSDPTDPPPRDAADLLVVGGLTIDRFADGRDAPGGSVLHAARAAAAQGRRVAVVTAAGPEVIAGRGLDELRGTCTRLSVTHSPATATFRHRETAQGRSLWREHVGGEVRLPADGGGPAPSACLLAPVAGEIRIAAIESMPPASARAAILQGWLRDIDGDGRIRQRRLADLPQALTAALRPFDLLVVSREDLALRSESAPDLLAMLGKTFGPSPTIVLTDGPAGIWVRLGAQAPPAETFHLDVPRRVEAAPTVGAGDILAAILVVGGWERPPRRSFVELRARGAMEVVAATLESRA